MLPLRILALLALSGCCELLRSVHANTPLDLHVIAAATASARGGVCLDGSPPGFYFGSAQTAADSNKWVLYFKGGAWCYNANSCKARSSSALGSSRHFAPTFQFGGVMDSDPRQNPDFATWNRVVLWYCDGASFSGDRDAPLMVGGTPIYFRGKRVLDALLDELLSPAFGMGSATDVLLAGGSAGGLSVYLHSDHVRQRMPPSVRSFKAFAISGFFLQHATAAGSNEYPTNMEGLFALHNSAGGVHPACLAAQPAGQGWRCMFAAQAFAYTTTPTFVVNSALDSWQVGNILRYSQSGCTAGGFPSCSASQLATLRGWASDFMRDMQGSRGYSRAGNAVFIETCFEHVGAQNSDGFNRYAVAAAVVAAPATPPVTVTVQQAVSTWWHSPTSTAAVHYLPCTLGSTAPHQCQPSCFAGGAPPPVAPPPPPPSSSSLPRLGCMTFGCTSPPPPSSFVWRPLYRQTAGAYHTPEDWRRFNAAAAPAPNSQGTAYPAPNVDFSVLDELERCRGSSNGKLMLRLVWPRDDPNGQLTMTWKQTTNPVTERFGGGVEGYEAVPAARPGWAGLEHSGPRANGLHSSLLDGTVNSSGWWYAVGTADPLTRGSASGIPGPPGRIMQQAELWAMCDPNYLDPCPASTWPTRSAAVTHACCPPSPSSGHRRVLQGGSGGGDGGNCNIPRTCSQPSCSATVVSFHRECTAFESSIGLMDDRDYTHLLADCAQHANPSSSTAAAAAAPCASSRSCAELSWPLETQWGTHANDVVCAPRPADAICSHGTWAEAAVMCESQGARLCTLDDLSGSETAGTGCGFDAQRTWTSSTSVGAACSPGAHSSAAGHPSHWAATGPECTRDSTVLAVRCCADSVAGAGAQAAGTSLCVDGVGR
jgi:hypothetical protein